MIYCITSGVIFRAQTDIEKWNCDLNTAHNTTEHIKSGRNMLYMIECLTAEGDDTKWIG